MFSRVLAEIEIMIHRISGPEIGSSILFCWICQWSGFRWENIHRKPWVLTSIRMSGRSTVDVPAIFNHPFLTGFQGRLSTR